MIISHTLKFIFVSNPKVASTSVEHAFASFHDEPEFDDYEKAGYYTKRHMPAGEIRKRVDPYVWERYYKVGLVRNPWDWFVSQHFYNLTKRGLSESRCDSKLSVDQIGDTYDYLRRYRGMPWAESACQHAFLCDRTGAHLVDFIGRYESIWNAIQAVASHLGVQVSLPHLNASNHQPYSTYYTTETADLIRRLYRRDIALFDYRLADCDFSPS